MDVDEILLIIGEFGKYQKMFLFLVLLPCTLPLSISSIGQILMITSPPQCSYADIEANNSSQLTENGTQYALAFEAWRPKHSQKDFVICESPINLTFFLVLIGMASIVGSFFGTRAQNRFGFMKSYFILLGINIVAGIGSALATSFWIWIALRFIVQCTIPVLSLVPFVLAVEMVGPRYRADMMLCLSAAVTGGSAIFGISVSYFKNWRISALTSSLPLVLLFLLWRYMSESPRWYLANGELDKAVQILQKMAKVNGRTLSEDHIMKLKEYAIHLPRSKSQEEGIQYTMLDLFTKRSLRMITIFVAVSSFSCSVVGNGLYYYVYLLGGDRFVNFSLSFLVQLPALIIPWPFMKRYGRRNFICCSMILGGTACILTQLFTDYNKILLLFFVGVMGNALAFLVLSLFIAELYPTPIRAVGMYFYNLILSVGATFVPAINYLGFHSNLPLVIFGVTAIIGGCSCFLLKETKDTHLPEQLNEKKENSAQAT